ncbi:TAXI family TRAP transporter solute-binding subunit [Actinocrispum sp. NPDC049592]|uniref:TAXI family TRAP transporter solute-binding subunit n=1 Tax=Actinocrispum sp. NPDC049592 TaxID=3154835 RepID=UPI0034437FDA
MISRRAFVLATAGLLAGCTRGSDRPLTIAAGEEGGFYLAFAKLLADQVNQADVGLRCTAVPTQASVANLELLQSGKADLALVLADTALTASKGNSPFTTAMPLRALGRVYENYMQLVVRQDGPIHSLGDLAGKTVSLGAAGSGAALFGTRMVAAAGIQPTVSHLPLADAVSALAEDRISALLWSGGVPTPALADLDNRVGIRLLSLDGVTPALRAAHGSVYESVLVPSGAYQHVRDTRTIGVANLLVSAPSLPPEVAGAVVSVLVTRASRLVPQQAVGTQFLDARTLIGTAGVPLHPGAAERYRELHG